MAIDKFGRELLDCFLLPIQKQTNSIELNLSLSLRKTDSWTGFSTDYRWRKTNSAKLVHDPGSIFKSFNVGIFLEMKTPKFFWGHLKCQFFGNKYWATCCQFKHFCCPLWRFTHSFWHFQKPNLYYEMEIWKCHHFLALCFEIFGLAAFMKLNNNNAINILTFCSKKFWRFGFVKLTTGSFFSSFHSTSLCLPVSPLPLQSCFFKDAVKYYFLKKKVFWSEKRVNWTCFTVSYPWSFKFIYSSCPNFCPTSNDKGC